MMRPKMAPSSFAMPDAKAAASARSTPSASAPARSDSPAFAAEAAASAEWVAAWAAQRRARRIAGLHQRHGVDVLDQELDGADARQQAHGNRVHRSDP